MAILKKVCQLLIMLMRTLIIEFNDETTGIRKNNVHMILCDREKEEDLGVIKSGISYSTNIDDNSHLFYFRVYIPVIDEKYEYAPVDSDFCIIPIGDRNNQGAKYVYTVTLRQASLKNMFKSRLKATLSQNIFQQVREDFCLEVKENIIY